MVRPRELVLTRDAWCRRLSRTAETLVQNLVAGQPPAGVTGVEPTAAAVEFVHRALRARLGLIAAPALQTR